MNSAPHDPAEAHGERTAYVRAASSGPDAAPGTSPVADEPIPAGAALLVVIRGPNAGSRFLLEGDSTSVGRYPSNDIRLDDVTVSRHHAELHRGEQGFSVRDLGSLNGLYLNRQPAAEANLSHGDEIQIGTLPAPLPHRHRPVRGDVGPPASSTTDKDTTSAADPLDV